MVVPAVDVQGRRRRVVQQFGEVQGLVTKAIADAPAAATPLEAVAHALDAAGREVFTPARRAFTARRQAVIAAHLELREREALKNLGLIASVTEALEQRGVPGLTARVAAELGALVFAIAYERWSDPANGDDFSELARRALDDVRATTALC